MSDEKKEFINKRKAEINNYENLLRAILSFKKFIEETLHAKYYFGGKLKKEKNFDQTPDIIIELNKDEGIIGEAKKSLRKIGDKESKSDYIKEYVEKSIITQLKKYDTSFDNFKIASHDLILLAPQVDNETLGIIKFDFLDKKNNVFDRNFAIIVYSIEVQANTKRILIRYDYGKISNNDLYDKLRRGVNFFEGELSKELGKYKIYEENENSTPIEYIMVILWDSIFNEILDSSNKENIVEMYRNKENKFQVKLSKLMEYLRKMYTIPTFINLGNSSNNQRQQFKINSVRDAMEIFCNIGLAKILSKENNDILYEITLKVLPEKNELDYFLDKIYNSIQERKFNPESQKTEKLDKYFVS
ncbi:MAG: hypothetical protein M1416_00030 [Candidatus Pacearchaeota archaeon]|nr:hypothetical protein [Candidatus Pacearchaeota archaeon]